MTARHVERCFTAAEATLFTPGAVASAHGQRIWYTRCDPDAAVRTALSLTRRSWVQAVTVVPEAADAAQAGLALAFAEHVRTVRRQRGLSGVCVTSPLSPALPGTTLHRLPHLVAVAGPEGTQDAVVWEIMTANRLTAWLGRHTMDPRVLEEWLPQLLVLRRAVRAGRLPDSPAGRALADLLRERYLSILLVAQHPPLFDDLLADPFILKEARPS
ncbi:hypothetical protein ACQEVF_56580 [Nonomuraea polychroma]|uniref:hypothetical protein n=1 Tax=Nonomuraea polychroma TaxID=46176 RepID=UPI003D8ADF7E